ncbi:hypothetical protein M9H77_06345 [Catharanthus roseus]|uniref:Uncharacterized protein n=1 Tax=Catharanthus roseus TaxID=4058 RepID=A0ACC0BRT0_CATRO|nr:hypothetical protein M9H77_06345 [Catharanthus roseus]
MKTSFRPGLKFVKNQVNGHVSRLHCTWIVPRTKSSSDDVDGFLTLRVDPLEEGRSTLRAWPNYLVESQEGLETEVGPRVDLVEGALMCLDSLRLPSCARNPHTRTVCKVSFYVVVAERHTDALLNAVDLVVGLGAS